MRISSVECTELFVGTSAHPRQVVRVTVTDGVGPVRITVDGDGVHGEAAGDAPIVEIGLPLDRDFAVGTRIPIAARIDGAAEAVATELVVAQPGWTVWMIPHFHYDPVWWNTQAAYTQTWDDTEGAAQEFRAAFQQTGFSLVALHLETARRDPDYKFVLAEVDYLKPYWDAHPADRAYLRRLLAQGRLEIMGGTYNEPNTNLTSAESTARNFVHGIGFQRDILGGDPRTAWQLDVFGHDPQFPGLAADAGLDSSSWARGPFHQWGPMLWTHEPKEEGWGDPSVMQFPAEFDWLSPSGKGVLTHYMPAHYSAGWQIDNNTTLAGAELTVYQLFLLTKRVAATRNVLLPVGTDYTPPSKWVTEIHRDWRARYVWPRFVCGLPGEFFAAVRAELDADGRQASAQTRDMNPVYTGKDVSFIDTKQAQRQAENLVLDAEKFATLATLHGARYPHRALDRAWRQLVYGAHHDAITGSESDQVYLDLLTGWREAHDIGRSVLTGAIRALAEQVPAEAGSVTVFNPSSWDRADLVTLTVTFDEPGAFGVGVLDPAGEPLPVLVEHPVRHADGSLAAASVTFPGSAPALGCRARWQLVPTAEPGDIGWVEVPGEPVIESAALRVRVDPARGGAVSELVDRRTGRASLRAGAVGNELLSEQEYSEHPKFHEGPWHLVPTGQRVGSADAPADSVVVSRCALGQRITVTGRLGHFRYTQQLTLWRGAERLDCRTELHGFDGADELVRVRWPVDVPGGLPVSEVGNAVVGRGFAVLGQDSAEHPWTLDNPANAWFAVSSTARVRVNDSGSGSGSGNVDGSGSGVGSVERAIGIAELVAPNTDDGTATRALAIALAGQGVTATSSRGNGPRYGRLAVDSNLPDVRIALGGPQDNDFVAAVLAGADPAYQVELDKQLAESGRARVWVPATMPLAEVWRPSADLSEVASLPVLIVVGDVEAVVADLADAVIEVDQAAEATTPGEPGLADHTVGLVNTGLPGFAVDATGALHLSLVRSCTGWPSGVWINPPRRTAPDGSNFQQQHWTQRFDYTIVAGPGDWRATGLVRAGHDVNHPLRAIRHDTATAGELPAEHSFLRVDPPGEVVLAALKPRGNPLASGREPGAVDGLTARLYEATGRGATARLRTAWPQSAPARLTLLEQRSGPVAIAQGAAEVALGPMEIVTLGLDAPEFTPQSTPESAPESAPGEAVLALGETVMAPETEPHQPVYARYWLHNTGPAPVGNLPVAVHVEPQLVEREPAATDPIALRISVSSDRTDADTVGEVEVLLPEGWSADLAIIPHRLAPGGHQQTEIQVRPAADAAAGTYWIRVRGLVLGQAVEDVCRVVLGAPGAELVTELLTTELTVRPGDHAEITVRLTNAARTPVSAQVQLVSPWHLWPALPDWNSGTTITAGASREVRFPVAAPADARPGQWWALVKVAHAGLVYYTEAIAVRVSGDE